MHRRFITLPAVCAIALALAGCGSSGSSASSQPTAVPALNHVHSIVILPTNANVLYMGSHYHLYKSTDGGKTWQPLMKQMLLSMAMDNSHPSILYGVSQQSGLIKTTNAGVRWQKIGTGVAQGKVVGVAVSPNGSTVLAYGNGIERSTDNGRHWSPALAGQSIYSAAFGAGETAYVGADAGLFVSQNGGPTWKSIKSLQGLPVIQVAAARTTAYAVSASGLMRSTDGGRTWKLLSKAPFGVEFMGVSPSNPAEVIAEVAGKGFYVSHNGGASWSRGNAGIHDTNFNASAVRVAPSAPNIVYTGAWGLDFYRSTDGGKHWTQVSVLRH